MRRFALTFLSLIVFAFLLSACSLFQKKEEVPPPEQEEIQLDKRTGIVVSALEANVSSPPSEYVLKTDNGETIFLTSLSVNLKRYKGRRVEALGRVREEDKVLEVDSLTTVGQETLAKVQYRNPQLGVSFSLPAVWRIQELSSAAGAVSVLITPYEVSDEELPTVDRITIEKSENNRKLSAREWLSLDELYRPTTAADSSVTYQQSTVGASQIKSVKKTFDTGSRVEFYLKRDDAMYIVSHTSVGDSDRDMNRNAFYDLVGSFDFIPFGPATGTSTVSAATEAEPVSAPILPELVTAAKEVPELSTTIARIASYIKQNIGFMANEPPGSGAAWSVSRIELVVEGEQQQSVVGAYVNYDDGSSTRRLLVSIPDTGDPSSIKASAYFVPGELVDWKLKEGSDFGKNKDKVVVDSSGATQFTVKKGMQLITSKQYKILFQIPSSWYWKFSNSQGYGFGTKAVENVSVASYRLRRDSTTDTDSATFRCVQKTQQYCLSYPEKSSEDVITLVEEIVASIQEQ